MSRICLLCLTLTLSIAVFAQSPSPQKPNVLLIMVDDLAEYVGFMNTHPQTVTPNMDRLARRGTVFYNAFCSSPQCAPSRTSMLSGKLPDYTGIYQGGQYTDSDFRSNFLGQPVYTLPEILKDSGEYYTVGVRKIFHARNHNLPGNDADYDESTSDECAKGKSWSNWLNNNNSDPVPTTANIQGWNNYEWGPYSNSEEPLSADYRAVDRAIEFLQNYSTNPSLFCDRPFFLGVGLFRPHIPYFSPEKYFSEYYQTDPYLLPYRKPYNDPPNAWPPNGIVRGTTPDDSPTPSDWQNLPYIGKVNANQHEEAPFNYFKDYPNTLIPAPIVEPGISDSLRDIILSTSFEANSLIAYLASIRYADEQIGRLLDALENEPELFENTIILLFSDHGYAFGEKLHYGKVALWDQVIRVPMVVVDPRKPGNRASYRPVSLLDVFPTVLELTGTPEPKLPDGSRYLDGMSFANLLDNPDAPRNKPVLVATELTNSYPDGNCFPFYSVFDQRFHYIRYSTNGPTVGSACDLSGRLFQEELYDLGEKRDVDPDEFFNLANNPQYDGIKEYLAQFITDGPLYNQQGGMARIHLDGLDCVLNLNNDITVKGSYTDANGVEYSTAPSGIVAEWTSPAFFAPVIGDSVVLGTGTVDPAQIAALKRLPLTLTYRDTTNGVVYRTLEMVNVVVSNIPSSTFSATETAPATFSLALLGSGGYATDRLWDFGDGTYSDEILPAPHHYVLPGTYTIKHTVRYGNDKENTCFKRTEVTVTVDASDFAGADCTTPIHILATSVSSNNAKLKWNPVFGASRYIFRARPVAPAGEPWLSGSRIDPLVIIPGLKPNLEYEYQVRAVCSGMATDTSDWSSPLLFQTPTCFPPVNLAVDNITSTTAQVSWDPHNSAMLAHEVLARPAAGGALIRIQVTGDSSTTFTSLSPATNYEWAVRPRCPNALGAPGVVGELTNKRNFTTLAARNGQDFSQILKLQPNPTADFATVQLSGIGGTLLVMDATGRVVEQLLVSQAIMELKVSDWASGFYLVEWHTGQGDVLRQKLMVQH